MTETDDDGRRLIWTTRKDIAENCFFLKGKKFTLEHYPPMHSIYNCPSQRMVIVSGRQIGKSTSAANFMVAECIGQPHWEAIGVLPSIMQMRRFSNQRVGKIISDSPIIKKWFTNSQVKKNTMERGILNGSMMYFGALSQVESLRGLSANRILEDEVQDMVSDDLPIVEEALSGQSSERQFILRTGTAKTVGNLLETTFRESTMCEWIVKCPAGHHNIPSAENIGKKGFTCKKCYSLCDVRDGYWKAMASHADEKKWVGFRVPQIILPLHTEDPKKWEEILRKKNGGVNKIIFANEVMGHAAGSGIDFLSEDDLRGCCAPDFEMYEYQPPRDETFYCRLATIDWGLTARKSYTLLSIWGVTTSGRLKLLHAHRYLETDIFKQVDDIASRIINFGAEIVGADWGAGFAQAVMLEEKIRRRVVRFMYVSEQRELAKYDHNATLFKVNRTQAMTETFLRMKEKVFWFPGWNEFQHFAKDILCIFMEPIDDKRTSNDKFKYDHPEDSPDDFAHTCTYAVLLLHLLRTHKL